MLLARLSTGGICPTEHCAGSTTAATRVEGTTHVANGVGAHGRISHIVSRVHDCTPILQARFVVDWGQ
jgi:hypothetical protein